MLIGLHSRPATAAAAACAFLCLASHAAAGDRHGTARASCPPPRVTPGELGVLRDALAAERDVLGQRLLDSREGPSYAAVRRLLPPLWYAEGRGGSPLTRSGAYYLTFAHPLSLYGEKAFALHVADGSAILTRRVDGPGLTILVGDGREIYGSCLARLGRPRRAHGWLPVLRTSYVDARGVRYAQESFAGRVPGVRSLVSFVRLAVDTRRAGSATAVVRFAASPGSRTRLVTDRQGVLDQGGARDGVRGVRVLYVAWVHSPGRGSLDVGAAAYDRALRATERFWEGELARGATFDVPERSVLDAERSLLVQQRILTWRYSVGNPYEELSFAEALDAARVMAGYGHADVSKAILRFALRRLPARFTSWRAGAVLLAAAEHYRLTRDATLLDEEAPAFALSRLARQVERRGGTSLLDREAFSSDVRRRVVGLHGQAVAWQGLLAMGRVWERLGHHRLAARATIAGMRLESALRAAVRSSQRRLPDGSLFVPATLLDGTRPFDRLTASRDGSYWNLVMPYALASGLFDPKGPTARGIWRYIGGHGGLLLGLVRADAARLYRGEPYPASGVDQVYGLNLARFLADADLPDQLVLGLYGTLAGAMTRGTFVSGEAATIQPLRSSGLGSMYLPPNGGTGSAFLETLRVALVHERRNARGAPVGLELAFATPRAWLRPGKTIRVERAPTSFGEVSYALTRRGNTVRIVLDAPRAPWLRLRLRLPRGERIERVETAGRSVPFGTATGTIELPSSGERPLRLVVHVT